ncbi:MAG: response regulator transcription factor [Formosimonas sp.]|jgi:DNA-binding NarL/FixJ family response regulator
MNDTHFNVLIADDHELILQAMQKLVGHLRPRMASHLVSDWPHLLSTLEQQASMDLAIVDLHMPGSGLDCFIELSNRYPDLPVVVVSAETSVAVVRVLFDQANIKGFIPKSDQAAVLLQALKLVLAGGKYLPAFMLAGGPELPEPTSFAVTTSSAVASVTPPQAAWGLSSRLQDVLRLLAQGLSNKMIARQLGISDLTVKTHVNILYKQMGVKNRAEATAMFLRQHPQ